MKLFFKFLNINIIRKSNKIKKISKKKFKVKKKIFEQIIEDKLFEKKWFLNNFEVFNFFLPKDRNKKFNYLEIGCYEGISSYYVLSKFNFISPTSKNFLANRTSFMLKICAFSQSVLISGVMYL